jgi:ribosomal-protein-serine acetyltransferase
MEVWMLSLPIAEGAELRALEPWNAAEFADHIARAREYVAPWVPFATTVVDEETAHELIQRYSDRHAKDDGRLYGLWVDGTLMGGTLFRTWDNRNGTCEVGVWLDPAMTGRGLITTAVKHMIDWAVCARGMSRVEWCCSTANKPSMAVAQRLGMSREGVLRQAFTVNGTRHDVEVWSLLATEWRSRN